MKLSELNPDDIQTVDSAPAAANSGLKLSQLTPDDISVPQAGIASRLLSSLRGGLDAIDLGKKMGADKTDAQLDAMTAGPMKAVGMDQDSALKRSRIIHNLATGVMAGAGSGGIQGLNFEAAAQPIADSVANGLENVAQTRSAVAQGVTKADIRRLGIDRVKQVGQSGLDNGIVTPLASTDTMLDRAKALKEQGGQQMGTVYKAIDDAGVSTFSPSQTADKVESELGGVYRSKINKGETSQLDNTIESITMRKPAISGDPTVMGPSSGGNISMQEAQALKEEIGGVAFPNGKPPLNPTDKQIMAKKAWDIISDSIDDAASQGAEKLGDPDLAQTLQEGKDLYSTASTSTGFLANKQAGQIASGGGNFIEKMSLPAAIAAIPATHGLSLKAWLAYKGVKAVGKYGNQVTAVGADALSDAARSAPAAIGKFVQPVANVAQYTPQAVNLSRWLTSQDDSSPDTSTKAAATYSPDHLSTVANNLANSGSHGLAQTVQDAATTANPGQRSATMFSLLQNPLVRTQLNDAAGTDSEEQ